MSCVSTIGIRLPLPRRAREPKPSPRAAINRRNALWYRAHTAGIPDESGRTRAHSTAEIAVLWGVTARAVQLGIAQIRPFLEPSPRA